MKHPHAGFSSEPCEAITDFDVLRKRLIVKEKELDAVVRGAKHVLGKKTFAEAARAIFDQCCELIGATSGYVALLSEDGSENEVLFLEDGGMKCTVDPELPMPIRGLRAESYAGNCAVYDNDFMNSEWVCMMPKGHMTLNNVMFAPLVIENETVGIMGMANKDGDFTDHDAEISTVFGELAAIALKNSQYLEELKRAFQQVKTLKGLIPVCAHCKSVRDDQGYWQRLEKYLADNSDAELSHGICPTCAEKYYPGIKI